MNQKYCKTCHWSWWHVEQAHLYCTMGRVEFDRLYPVECRWHELKEKARKRTLQPDNSEQTP